MNDTENTQFIIILRTGKVMDFDMASNTLKEARILVQCNQVSDTGVRLVVPATPTPAPGVWYTIAVPRMCLEEATELLQELPIELTTNPSTWHSNSSPEFKGAWRIYSAIIIAIIAAAFVFSMIQQCRHL